MKILECVGMKADERFEVVLDFESKLKPFEMSATTPFTANKLLSSLSNE